MLEKRVDMRSMSLKEKELMRLNAIRIIQSGATQERTAEILGIRVPTVSEWVKRFGVSGEQGLKELNRGAHQNGL